MKIGISAETTIDLNKKQREEHDIHTVPFTISIGTDVILDDDNAPEKIFKHFDETGKLSRTSAVNPVEYINHFKKLLKKYDQIIHFSLSSKLSSAYKNAVEAANVFNGKVKIIDTKSLSSGIALLAFYAEKLVKEDKYTIKEIVEKVEERISNNQTSFIIEKVNYLYKGGRCSALSYIGANILKIRPQIVVKDGGMVSGKKYRGKYEMTVLQYVKDTLLQFNNPDLSQVFITTTSENDELESKIETILREKGFKNIDRCIAGGTISCHCGPNCLGILYLNDGNH